MNDVKTVDYTTLRRLCFQNFSLVSENPFKLVYLDEENEIVTLGSLPSELEDALKVATTRGGVLVLNLILGKATGATPSQLQEEQQKLLMGIENLLQRGDSVESIAELLVRSVEEITALVAQIEAKKP